MTRIGWGALTLGSVLVAIGVKLVWAPLVILGAGCLLLVGVGLSYLIRRPRLTITRQIQPARVSKGSLAIAYLELRNRGRLAFPSTPCVQQLGKATVRLNLPRLARRERAVRTCRLPTNRRGVFELGPVEITRADPFAFVRMTQRHAGTDSIWVYPQVFGFRPLPSGLTRPLEGPTSDTAPQGNITFHQLREYVVGDDLRMIHWKSTARTGQLMVRHNIDTSQPFTVVLSDVRPSVHSEGTFELALDVAASVLTCASVGMAPVQLRTSAGASVGGPQRRDIQPMLDYLTTVEPSESGSLHAQLVDIKRQGGGTALVVITGRPGEQDVAMLGSMRAHFQRVVMVAVTNDDVPVPAVSGVSLVTGTDAESLLAAWNLAVTR